MFSREFVSNEASQAAKKLPAKAGRLRWEDQKSRASLLIAAASILQPAVDVSVLWITMRPVDDAAFVVPLRFAIESDPIALA